jgi:hypothetical protein
MSIMTKKYSFIFLTCTKVCRISRTMPHGLRSPKSLENELLGTVRNQPYEPFQRIVLARPSCRSERAL